jgi:hypothetical protein
MTQSSVAAISLMLIRASEDTLQDASKNFFYRRDDEVWGYILLQKTVRKPVSEKVNSARSGES